MNIPDMTSEVLDAVHQMYEDYPDVEIDCYRFLGNLTTQLQQSLSYQACQELRDRGLCHYCGEPLVTYHYTEIHRELDGCPKEDMYEVVCGNESCPKYYLNGD